MNNYRIYLDEIIEQDGTTPNKYFFRAFEELLEKKIIGGTIADYRSVRCFYEWNKDNLKNGTKDQFIREFVYGSFAI